jgi:mono/diheme cytochrome c family protein
MSETTINPESHTAHATVGTYMQIAIILAVVTAIELVIPSQFVPFPAWLKLFLLGVFSVAKFVLVVLFFMHLWFDSKLLWFLFAAGLIMATLTLISVKALFNVPSIAGVETKAVVKLKPPDPANGPKIVVAAGCIACHTITAVPEARGTVGPKLDGIGTRAATRKSGYTADAYIKESIEQPGAYVVEGYANVMPPDIRDRMSDQDFVDLVSYLESLK